MPEELVATTVTTQLTRVESSERPLGRMIHDAAMLLHLHQVRKPAHNLKRHDTAQANMANWVAMSPQRVVNEGEAQPDCVAARLRLVLFVEENELDFEVSSMINAVLADCMVEILGKGAGCTRALWQ